MNFEVKSAEDSDFPRMHLVVVDDKSGNHIESPYHYSKDDGSETGAIEVSIAFDNPYTPDEFNEDLQFAMEVQSNSGEEADTPGAEFLGGGAIGCDHNKRVSARLKDSNGIVKLQITDPNAKLKVLAGWATGHEAVRLTHPLILEPALVSDKQETTADNQDDEAEIDEADLKADDDGPTLMDDEIQEENLPKVLNTSDIEADIERDVAVKDAIIAQKDATIQELRAFIAQQDATIAQLREFIRDNYQQQQTQSQQQQQQHLLLLLRLLAKLLLQRLNQLQNPLSNRLLLLLKLNQQQ